MRCISHQSPNKWGNFKTQLSTSPHYFVTTFRPQCLKKLPKKLWYCKNYKIRILTYVWNQIRETLICGTFSRIDLATFSKGLTKKEWYETGWEIEIFHDFKNYAWCIWASKIVKYIYNLHSYFHAKNSKARKCTRASPPLLHEEVDRVVCISWLSCFDLPRNRP